MVNIQNASFITSSLPDKIVGIYTGSYISGTQTTTLGGYLYQFPIPHQFSRPVFCELDWSTDGVTYYSGGGGIAGSNTQGIAYSDSSNIYITTGLSTGVIYYKVVCTWIDNYDTSNPGITAQNVGTGATFFDSRANYPKILAQDVVTDTIINTTVTAPAAINPTNYLPNFKVFFESITGQVWPTISGGTADYWLYAPATQSECTAYIDASSLWLTVDIPFSGHATRIWYRIYGDS